MIRRAVKRASGAAPEMDRPELVALAEDLWDTGYERSPARELKALNRASE